MDFCHHWKIGKFHGLIQSRSVEHDGVIVDDEGDWGYLQSLICGGTR
jgi:hypothetical protein